MGLLQVYPTPVTWHLMPPSAACGPAQLLEQTAAQMTAGSFIADALVVSPALFPAFEASVIPRDFTGACFLSMKPIESALNNAIDFLCVCARFASNAAGFSHLIPLEPKVLFILCNFLFMYCFCPAVVCHNDK